MAGGRLLCCGAACLAFIYPLARLLRGGVIDVLAVLSSNPQIVFVFLREDMSTAIPALCSLFGTHRTERNRHPGPRTRHVRGHLPPPVRSLLHVLCALR